MAGTKLVIIGGVAGYLVEMVYFLLFKANDHLASIEIQKRFDEVIQTYH